MVTQPSKDTRAARKRARNDAATPPVHPDGDMTDPTTTTASSHGPHASMESVSVQGTPRPDGPHPTIPSTHDGRMLPHDAVYSSQPIRAEEVTVWALSLARKATQGVVRNVARQDASGYGQDVRVRADHTLTTLYGRILTVHRPCSASSSCAPATPPRRGT